MTTTIYGLIDPADPEQVRYIGQTRKPIEQRLAEHCRDKKKSHKRNWIIALSRQGRSPLIRSLDVCSNDRADSRERGVIAECRQQGFDLLNHTDGGNGMRNWIPTAETRSKMSASGKGKRGEISAAGLQAISDHMKSRVVSAETRRRISEAKIGRKLPAEAGQKMSRSRTGRKLSAEHKSNLAKAIRDWWAGRKAEAADPQG